MKLLLVILLSVVGVVLVIGALGFMRDQGVLSVPFSCQKFSELRDGCGLATVQEKGMGYFVIGKVSDISGGTLRIKTKTAKGNPALQPFTVPASSDTIDVTTTRNGNYGDSDPRTWKFQKVPRQELVQQIAVGTDIMISVKTMVAPQGKTTATESVINLVCASMGKTWFNYLQNPTVLNFLTLFPQKYVLHCRIPIETIFL